MDGFIDDDAAQRHSGIVDGLGESDHVRLDAKEISGERRAKTTEARDDLVKDQQDAVFAADLAQAGEIAFGRDDHAGRALHRLDNDCGDIAGIVQCHDPFEFVRQMQAPLGLTARVAHLAGVEGVRQMVDARDHQRREHLAVGRNAAHRNAAHADAMIGALAADDARAGGIASRAVVGDGNLEGGIDSLRAGIDKEHAITWPAGQFDQSAGQRKRGGVTHLEARREVECGDLLLHGLHDARW